MSTNLVVPNFTAVAVNATEMKAASTNIKNWLEGKLISINGIITETQESLDVAIQNAWGTKTFTNAINREKQKLLYYGKMLDAINAGYTIVPNMDVDVFAIRVKTANPRQCAVTNKSTYKAFTPYLTDEQEQHLPAGEGRYESPKQLVAVDRAETKNEKGETQHIVTTTPVGFAELEFPLAVANPVVMDATAHALSMKIFDRIGIVTDRTGDPIVLGQIRVKQYGWRFKTASFLIAWYLDTRTL